MSKIVLATFGSLGDLHPKIAIGLELKVRGHNVTIAAMEYYREKIGLTGLGFAPMAPHLDPDDRHLVRDMMDPHKGTEEILGKILLSDPRPMFDDLVKAARDADLLVTGEVVIAARSVVETTGIKWVSTSVAPISFMSAYDPPVPPPAPWFENLRFMPAAFHRLVFNIAKNQVRKWYGPYRSFRERLGLDPDHDPIFDGKFSDDLHLAIFSKVLGVSQPDWPPHVVQTGFCFYDGQSDSGQMPPKLDAFLGAGEPPIVFTLGSAAVMDPGEFFNQSIKAAKLLKKRAVILYGQFNDPPDGLDDDVVGFEYAPFSALFPLAACVVHQGGVGTTGQVLRAGVPHLIMPYGHDQPDNAARCRRLGVAEVISRTRYSASSAASLLSKILTEESYLRNARQCGAAVRAEYGALLAADEIEKLLR
ncbi:MAG: glycosyltransferase [Pyrinomonadaceae bacterium]